jgi:uncharacterized protein YqeY
MSLKQQLTEEMKQAMRDRNSMKLNTIRFLLSDIKNVEIDEGEQDDTGVRKIVARQIKAIKDAVEDFKKAGRTDIVDEEMQKVAILETFLPTQLSDEELVTIATDVKNETGLTVMGPLIGAVKEKVGDQADGQRVAAAVKQVLS